MADENNGGAGGTGSNGGAGSGGTGGAAAQGSGQASSGGGAAGASGSGGAAGATASWRDGLPAELKDHASLKQITDVQTLAKGYLHAQHMIGANKIEMPSPKWGKDEWDAHYKAVGRPDAPEGYKFDAAKIADAKLPEATVKELQGLFHRHGLTARQAEGFMADFIENGKKSAAESQQRRSAQEQATKTALQQKFGADLDTKLEVAKAVVAKFGGQPLQDYLAKTGLGNHPGMVQMFIDIGKHLMEDSTLGVGGTNPLQVGDAATAKAEILRLQGDESFMKKYLNRDAIGHKDAVDVMLALNAKAYPEKPKS